MGRIGTIVNRKNSQDKKKSKIFTKLIRKIVVAVKEGGADPEYNPQLLNAIENAKTENMPNENIERAIKKASGNSDTDNYDEITYEGYGSGGIAVLVECLTDNVNRTASDVRSYFNKTNGNLGTNGCVSYLFDHLGVLVVNNDGQVDEDKLMGLALEYGAEDFVSEKEHFEIYTQVSDFSNVRDNLKNEGYSFSLQELTYLPQVYNKLSNEEDIKDIKKLIDMLEENDDVQNIYTNWEE